MTRDEQALQRTIGSIYTVIDGDTSWDQIAASVSSLFAAPFVYVVTPNGMVIFGKDAAQYSRLGKNRAAPSDAEDPLTSHFAARFGQLVDLNNLYDRAETFGRTYLANVVRPGRHAHMVGIGSKNDRGGIHSIILARTAEQAAFDAEEMRNLCRLSVHVGRVADIVSWSRSQASLHVPGVAVLRSEYNLTQQEARVAQEIARGLSINQIVESLGIGRETVRFHIRHILDKSHTASCGDFAANLGRFAAGSGAE